MENKYYGMQLKIQKRGQCFWQRPCFSLLIVLFFLMTALVAILRPGYTHTANNIPMAPQENNFVSPNQTAYPPAEQAGEVSKVAGADKPAQSASVKPPPPTQSAGEGEYDAIIPRDRAQTTVPQDPEKGGYDYSKPVPAAAAALPDSYFKDAVFIGDSRTEGFRMFSGPKEATYFTAKGLKVDTIFTKEVVENNNGKKTTIIEALAQTPFQKVYIMLGINELGWAYSDLFIKKYGEAVDEIKNMAPQTQIYIQSLLPVSKERSNSDTIFNNTNIEKYNALIQQMAAEKELYYLNVAQCVADPEGNLASEASTDGIHLQKTYCDLWLDYLKQHYVLP